MMYVILATFLFCYCTAFPADETKFHYVASNKKDEHGIPYSAPVFEDMFENVTAEEFKTLEVLCSAVGDPPITYEWLDPQENEISSDSSKTVYIVLSDKGSSLFISNVSIEHQGAYICTASNEHGLVSKFFNIVVKEKNSKNESDTNDSASIVKVAADVKNNSISFKIYTSGNVDTIFGKYSEILAPVEKRIQWQFGGIGPYEVKNLTASGKYSFQFKLSESDDWSKTYTYVMLPDMPQVLFRGLSDDALKIEWFRSRDNIMRETIDKHELSYYAISQVQGNYFEKRDCAVTVEIPKCSGSSYTITPLFKGSYYEIRVRAHTSAGYGEPSYFIIYP